MSQSNIAATILVDNEADAGLVREHGFAMLVEVHGHRILFDTGQGKALIPNAAAMGCDLGRTEMLVLSHGHYDHTGAVAQVLSAGPAMKVFCHAGVTGRRYSIRPGQAPHDISMPPDAKDALLALPPDRVQWLTEPVDILPGVGITGPIPRQHRLEDTGGPFFLDHAGVQTDLIEDDTAMWIRTARGLIVITGCCHSGLINTVEYIRGITPEKTIAGIIGGLHLNSASQERLNSTCDALQQWSPEFIIPCHCTGTQAIAFLKKQLGKKVVAGYAGMKREF